MTATGAALFVREIPASARGAGAGDGLQDEAGDWRGVVVASGADGGPLRARVSTIKLMTPPTMASMLRPGSVIADADTGYGSPLHVVRTVRAYERAGATAIQLEDQAYPSGAAISTTSSSSGLTSSPATCTWRSTPAGKTR